MRIPKVLSATTDFVSGGGSIKIIDDDPVTIRVTPHNEGKGGWSQVWWYFMVEGFLPGDQVIIELDRDNPLSMGVSPQIFFSYDLQVWGLTDSGEDALIEGREFFIYKHLAKGNQVWYAYDLPYTPNHIDSLLIPLAEKEPNVEITEFCKTKKNRSVKGLKLNPPGNKTGQKYGIWLQARAHAFESGSSWVLHELTAWLLSEDPEAVLLRDCAQINILPIVDVDGVVEGRTGKYQQPIDHWMNWEDEPSYWEEVRVIKLGLNAMARQNMVDLFIDFHGPGSKSHPYFILPYLNELPFQKQKENRNNFFRVLDAKELDQEAKLSQSMTKIHYSERPWDSTGIGSSHGWVTRNTNEHTLAFTLEVNMNTLLSSQEGYRSEGIILGRAISKYFRNGYHKK